jgi:hypothetical protein
MPPQRGVLVGSPRIWRYSRGQIHPPTRKESAMEAARPAAIPPPKRHQPRARTSSGSVAKRLYLTMHRLAAHPAAKGRPRAERARAAARHATMMAMSCPITKQLNSGRLQQQASTASHRRPYGHQQTNATTATNNAACQTRYAAR